MSRIESIARSLSSVDRSSFRRSILAPRPWAWQGAVVILAAAIYALVLLLMTLRAHEGLRTQMGDLGNMVQAVWGASHGDWLMTQSNEVDQQIRSRFGVHANFVFFAIVPFYLLWSSPKLLLLLTTLACVAAGLGIHALARRRLGDTWWALIPPVAFWLNPMVHDANLYDFHVVTLVTALLVWMMWAFEAGRPRLGWSVLAVALLCQEDVALLVVAYGAYRALSGHRRQGLTMMAVGLTYVTLLLGLIVPHLNQGRTVTKLSGPDDRFTWLLKRPGEALVLALQPERLRLTIYFLLAGAVACLRQWRLLLLLVPAIFSSLFSQNAWMSRVTGTYYWSFDAAVIAVACSQAAQGSTNLLGRWPLLYLAVATTVLSCLLSPLPHSFTSSWENHDRVDRASALREVMKDVPLDQPLVVQNNLGGQLAERPLVSQFPRRLEQAQYAVFYLRHVGGPNSGLFVRPDFAGLVGVPAEKLLASVQEMMSSPSWSLVRQQDGFYLFRRGPGPAPSLAARSIFAKDRQALLAEVADANRHIVSWCEYLAGSWRWTRRGP
jgi:uncharacterized membrane protein